MKTKINRLILALILPVLASADSGAREQAFVNDAEPDAPSSIEDAERWKESKTPMPPWPKGGDLVAFEISGAPSTLKLAIDRKSLSVGRDRVVRYTLVATTGSGTENVSFEGIRCTLNGEYKIYGYGIDGRIKPAPETDWLPIDKTGFDRYRYDLWRYHLCVHRTTSPRPKKDMIRSLQGRNDAQGSTGFMTD